MGRPHTISHFNRLSSWLAAPSSKPRLARLPRSRSCRWMPYARKMESIAETLLIPWVRYSRSLRLSVVERFLPRSEWEQTRQFIETIWS